MKKTLFTILILALANVVVAQIDENSSGQKDGEKIVVGAIGGTVDVTALGGASYTIPIQVPEGINRMQPSLAINYNSQSGNGLLGWGWNLVGASAITRVGQTLYHDGQIKGVDFNDDRFALDGQRLLLVNNQPYGGNGAEYRTEVDGMAKIVSYTCDTTNGPAKFKVWLPNGNIAYYGYKDNTRIGLKQRNDVCMWMLDSIVDRNGNYVAYRYHKGTTSCRLRRILYTGNAQADIKPAFRIELEYDNRIDDEIAFIGNNALLQGMLLNRIKVYNDEDTNGLPLWQYDFEYQQGDFVQTPNMYNSLRAINFICDNKKFNPTIIGRNGTNCSPQIHDITLNGSAPGLEMSGVKFTGDFNGDGYTDVIGLREIPYKIHVFLNNGHPLINGLPDENRASFKEIATYDRSEYLDWIYVGDFDGDGLDDFMCVIREPGVLWDHLVMKPYITRKNNDGSVYFVECEPLSNGDYLIGKRKELTLVMGDFLGNKRMSFIYQTHKNTRRRHFYIYYNGDYSNNCPFGQHSVPDLNAKCMRAADFNGDGKTEIWYYSNNDNDWFGKIVRLTPDFEYEVVNDHVLARNDKVFTGDFNGDGHVDLLAYVGNDSKWKIFLFKENAFYWQSYNITNRMPIGDPGDHGFSILNDDGTYKAVEVADFNGDGKSDIATVGKINDRKHLVFLFAPFTTDFTSNGCAHWVPIMLENTGIDFSNQREICVGNFLGRENVALFSRSKTFAYPPLTDRYNASSITDGMGNRVQFHYQYLMPYGGFYQITHNEPSLGNGCFAVALPMKGVNHITKSNTNLLLDINGESFSYNYQDAIIHNRGVGFLGFEKVNIRHSNGPETLHKRHFTLNASGMHRYMLLDSDSCWVTPRSGASYNKVLASVNQYYYEKKTNLNNQKVYMPLGNIQINDQFDIYNGGRFLNRSIVRNYYEESSHYQNTVHCSITIQGTGLAEDETGAFNAPFRNITVTKYQPEDYNQWVVNRPFFTETTSYSNEDPNNDIAVMTTFDYEDDNPYLVTRQTVYPGGEITSADPLATYTETKYDVVGHVDFIISGDLNALLPVATTDYVYYPNNRQLKKQINQAGYVTRYSYDPTYGYCNSTTDCNGLVTHFFQDPMGVLSQTDNPDGTMTNVFTGWVEDNDNLKPEKALYYQSTQRSGEAESRVYYDAMGQERRRVTIGFKGDPICVDTEYDYWDNPYMVTEPFYFFNLGNARSTVSHYDNFNRIDITTAPDGTSVKTEVEGFKTTITHLPAEGSNLPNQVTSSTVNAVGWTIESVDANNTSVNYGYYPDGKLRWTQIGEDETTRINLEYDNAGNRKLLIDPNYGTVTSVYNAYGQLRFNTDPKGNVTEYQYDDLGRNIVRIETDTESEEQETTTWLYDYSGNNRLDYIYSPNQAIHYEYDVLGRLSKIHDKRSDMGVKTTSYQYDDFSRIRKVTYPTGYTIRKTFNEYGYLTHIRDNNAQPLWKTVYVNEYGQVKSFRLGSNIYGTRDFDESHRLQATSIEVNGEIIQSFSYHYDDFSNLDARKDSKYGMEECFLYDDLNRLTTITRNGVESSMGYDSYGRLISKQADGQTVFTEAKYETYDQSGNLKPHAISEATMPSNPFPTQGQSITYTMSDKVKTISQDNRTLSYNYGYDHQRIHMEERVGDELVTTKDYYGNCEIIDNGSPIPHTYLSGPLGTFAVVRNMMGEDQVSFILKDHLGSWTAITDSDGNLLQELSFDAWGNLRDPETWIGEFEGTPLLDRGFTGHEHLYNFGLINMNGRMYDPVMSSFLSVDNYVQQPDNSQNFNRYAYCLNNPLKYTDPSGEEFGIFAAMVVASMSSVAINGIVNSCNGRNFYDGSFGAFMGGATSAAVGGVMGGAVATLVGGTEGFVWGGVVGAAGGLAGGYAGGYVGTWCNGGSPQDCMTAGIIGGVIGMGAGFVCGGLQGGIYAKMNGGNFWSGIGTVNSLNVNPELMETTDFDMDYYYEHLQNYEEAFAEGSSTLYEVEVGDIGIDRLSTDITSSTNPDVIKALQDYSYSRRGYIELNGSEKFGITVKSGMHSSEVYASPRVVDGYMRGYGRPVFDATIRHEFTHAYHRFALGDLGFRNSYGPTPYSEDACQHITKNVYYSYGLTTAGNNISFHPYPKAFIVPANYKFSILNFKNIYPKDWYGKCW